MAGVDSEEEGIGTVVSRVVEDARDLVGAELALLKARAGERIGAYRSAAIFFAIAGVIGLVALIALPIGVILTLATLIGPGYATVIVIVVLLVMAAVFGLVGKARLAPPRLPGTPS